ncbi:MAG: ATPase V [Paludibacteraceae bacterium]|nr:ATPase V [Paludibacteraceae bacterium]
MISQMKKYTFLVFHRDYDRFLEQLREKGVVHITEKASGLADNEELQAALQQADDLRRIISAGAPDQLIQERAALVARIKETEQEMKRVAVWGDFQKQRLDELQQAGYQLRFFSCAKSAFREEWGITVAEKDGRIYFVEVSTSAQGQQDLSEWAQEERLGDKCAAELQQDIANLNGLLVAQDARIEAWQQTELPKVKTQLEEVRRQIDWKRVNINTQSLAEGSLKLLEGFCPADQAEALNEMLDKAEVYYEENDPQVDDATPIQLKNNKFIQMFEPLTKMYGMPAYSEFDPTAILGPFFILFFALCIGDAGYGLLLILIGYLLKAGKLKIEMFDGMGPIIMALGVGSTLVGYVMGTFFGVDLFLMEGFPDWAKTCMVKNLGDPANEYKIAGYDVMMVAALVIGIVHICLAMVVKCICYTNRFGFKQTISSWAWLLLILGGLITVVLAMTNLVSLEATKIMLIAIGAVSALGIYIFNTIGRNPLINIGAGLWDTYNMATGIMGDVLSYIRLYALGLAGGMLGAAFNQLATMVLGETPNVGTWVGFLLIVVIGHVLNLLMACLGAFVHPLRLTFVEYFKNAGYEGSGKEYTPFKK